MNYLNSFALLLALSLTSVIASADEGKPAYVDSSGQSWFEMGKGKTYSEALEVCAQAGLRAPEKSDIEAKQNELQGTIPEIKHHLRGTYWTATPGGEFNPNSAWTFYMFFDSYRGYVKFGFDGRRDVSRKDVLCIQD
jgi:hypothetical protein